MGIRFFVDPEETDIKHFKVTGLDVDTGEVVTEDHWIALRADLSDREWKDLEMGIASRVNADGEIVLDFAGLSTKQLLLWVKKWSFYMGGNPRNQVKPTEEFLGRLDTDVADQVREIIKDHTAERKAAKEAMRNPIVAPLDAAVDRMKARAGQEILSGGSATSGATSSTPTPRPPGTSLPSLTVLETPESE